MKLQHKYSLADIISGCQKAERRSQEALYKLMASKMFGVCMRYAKNQFEAEDMLQTGFIKVFRNIDSYRGDGSFEGWVRRIMVNTSIEFYRKNLKTLGDVDVNDFTESVFVEFEISNLNARDLMRLVQALPDSYRMVFNMYAIEGYSHREIGQIIGITEGASKAQLSRARAILRDKIKKMEGQSYESNVG